ncbi:MAG: hypothetical protein ACU84H_08050 [Gammaproteobacteria bacterium]
MKALTFASLITALLLTAGCADGNYRPYTLDDSFGKTARHMVQAQIADPEAAAHPLPDSPRKMDGYAGVQTLDGYRGGFGQVSQPEGLTINIGGAGGGSSSGGSQ